MNKSLLALNKTVVEYCINHGKWKWYLLYLKIIKKYRYKHKSLDKEESVRIFNDIDLYLEKKDILNRCLVRSSLAMVYLIGYNNKFTMNIGVGNKPFRAHAWISLEDIPICEAEDIDAYTLLTQY